MDIYNIIETQVVDQMTPVIELSSIDVVSATSWKLYSCNTEWLTIGMTITIDGSNYLITSFVQDEYLIVTGSVTPVQLYFQMSAPHFEYGSHRKTNIERGEVANKTLITPFVYAFPVKNPKIKFESESPFAFDGNLRLFFLHEFNETTPSRDVHQTNIINPMKAMAKYAITIIETRPDLFDDVEDVDENDHMDFGDPEIWGNKERIFDENLSGVENAFRMRLYDDEIACGCCQSEISGNCMPVRFSLNGVFRQTIDSGDDFGLTIVDTLGNDPLVSYNSTTKTATVDAVTPCAPVSVTFNTVPVTSTPSGETKAVSAISQAANPVGDVTVDDTNNLEITIANSLIKNAATPTWTDTVESEQPYTLDPQPYTDSNGDALTQNYDPAVPIICTPCVALPTAGLNIPLSFTGANLVNYTSHVPFTSPNVYNNIARGASGGTSFNMNIFSIETMTGGEDWVIEGDNLYLPTASYFWGFGLQSNTGINYVDIDFCFFVTTSGVIQWIESGVNTGTVTTTTNAYWSWRLEYNGTTKEIKLYINGNLVKTKVTTYVAQTLVVKACGRNANQNIANHVNLRKVASSNRILVPIGDSITANDPNSNFPGRSYVEKMIAFSNHKYFVNPVLAIPGSTTANVIATQLPLAAIHYNASYTSNVANLMIGINDIRASVALATIQTNIQTIVSSLQTTGYYVIIHTVLRDFSTAWADRFTLNTWILAGSSGADQIIDHTTSVLESDSSYFTNNISPIGLHPNANGTTQIAIESYPGLLTAP